jgi:hypothetical protein
MTTLEKELETTGERLTWLVAGFVAGSLGAVVVFCACLVLK